MNTIYYIRNCVVNFPNFLSTRPIIMQITGRQCPPFACRRSFWNLELGYDKRNSFDCFRRRRPCSSRCSRTWTSGAATPAATAAQRHNNRDPRPQGDRQSQLCVALLPKRCLSTESASYCEICFAHHPQRRETDIVVRWKRRPSGEKRRSPSASASVMTTMPSSCPYSNFFPLRWICSTSMNSYQKVQHLTLLDFFSCENLWQNWAHMNLQRAIPYFVSFLWSFSNADKLVQPGF